MTSASDWLPTFQFIRPARSSEDPADMPTPLNDTYTELRVAAKTQEEQMTGPLP
jgi:hypothetical protein